MEEEEEAAMVLGVRVGRRRQVARMARCGRRSGIGGESVRMVGGGGRLSVGMEMDGGVELRCRVLTAWRMSQRCLSVGLERTEDEGTDESLFYARWICRSGWDNKNIIISNGKISVVLRTLGVYVFQDDAGPVCLNSCPS
jgi:hypothetical protein